MFNNKRVLRTGAVAVVMVVIFAVFAFRAAEWTKGVSSEFIVYGQATTGSTGGGGGTGGTKGGGSSTKVIPQIAVAFDAATH